MPMLNIIYYDPNDSYLYISLEKDISYHAFNGIPSPRLISTVFIQ